MLDFADEFLSQRSTRAAIKPCPGPAVEFSLRQNSRCQAGLGLKTKSQRWQHKASPAYF